MLERLLVPTDGSEESEKALGIAQQIARAQGAEILLAMVIEPSLSAIAAGADFAASPVAFQEAVAGARKEAGGHLAALEGRVRADGIRARSAVVEGPMPAALLDYETKEHPDLVVMATHGRTGLARIAMGSVTDSMVREGTAPVLVIRRSGSPAGPLAHALVMLDGSELAEEALPMVDALAGKPLQSITFFRTVADPRDQGPAATYLEGVAGRFARNDVRTSVVVDVGDPRPAVERASKDVDLIVLCTHGRGGFDRLRHGSVAEHVTREIDKPALLVRAAAQATGSR
jgi:nucleotide-binding universal stress UspA family protein